MFKKISIIYITYLVIILVSTVSCGLRCGGGNFPDNFRTIDLEVNPFEYDYFDPYGYCMEQSTYNGDTISFNNIGIKITGVSETFLSSRVETYPFSFLTPIYACEPALPQTLEVITGFQIICNQKFDIEHDKGSDISNLFGAVVPMKRSTKTNNSYQNCSDLTEIETIDYFLANKEKWESLNLDLVLLSPPTESGIYSFTIKLTQTSDYIEYIEVSSSEILIRP